MSRIYLSAPHMGDAERQLLLDAFDSNWIAPLGPHVDGFEAEFRDYVGAPAAAALSSGSAALHLALQMLGVAAGDRVLVPSLTFGASAFPIRYLGAEPVFADIEAASMNLDPALLAQELEDAARAGRLPKAVVVVHLYGTCADMDPILAACARWEVPVIEDAAEALGATYKGRHAGTLAELGFYSFNGNKIITCSGGGMLVAQDPERVRQTRFLATQAREPAPHYQHEQIGFNYRMSNLLAAVGRGQLRVIEDRVATRRAGFDAYVRMLADVEGIRFTPEPGDGRANRWLTVAELDSERLGVDREELRLALEEQDIEARPVWKPMHLQPVFASCRMVGGAVAERLFADGLCLPSGSSMSEADRERVVACIRARVGARV